MNLALKTLTITRRGQVNWLVKGANHCGPRDQLRWLVRRPNWTGKFVDVVQNEPGDGELSRPLIPVKYVVVVQCAPKLDDRGFLFDQVTMADYMAQLAGTPTDLSCEYLADHAAQYVMRALKRDAPVCRVRALTMTLSPAPFAAEVTASYGPSRADGRAKEH